MIRSLITALCIFNAGMTAVRGEALLVENLTSSQIAQLDRQRTVAILVGGIVEQHGPYLPTYTDGFISQRLAADVAAAAAARGWTALQFPQIPLGSSAANEIGGRYVFPGSYTVRNETLRAVYMDLASQLGEAGLRHVLVVHLHGAPLQNRMLDEASDYFRAAYGGRMVNLYGLMRVQAGWSAVRTAAPAEAVRADGFCVHACLDETSLVLHLKPELADPAYVKAPPWAGGSIAELRALARRPDWPGYFGAPQYASATIGRAVYEALSNEIVAATVEFLSGRDNLGPRYADVAGQDAVGREIDLEALRYEEGIAARQRAWLRERGNITNDAAKKTR